MSKVQFTLACGDYDRTRPLWDGKISPEGLDLNVLLLPVEEIFLRMSRHQEFDASELSFSTFLITRSQGHPRFVAIPAFPSRKFRHADIYIHRDSGIKKPQDLKGGRIGLPEYQITAAVWVRGILQEFYGVAPSDVQWITGHEERLKIELPPSIRVQTLPAGETLFGLLRKKELDAVLTARVPPPFLKGENWIARLFPNFKEMEIDYFQKTRIFPIMHTVVLREEVYERYPWAARSLFKAFCQAKDLSFDYLLNLGAPPVTLPWFFQEMDQTLAIMGRDFWPYGLKANRPIIVKLLQYMQAQGLVPESFNPPVEELFAPNTRD
jgi:4,5-dihydroxyphthalate decarboxylase